MQPKCKKPKVRRREKTKRFTFSLVLLNSKKPAVKKNDVLKIKREKERQRPEAQWTCEEEGSP